VLEILANLSS